MKTKDLIKKGKRKAYNKGFTLIELIVTVVIIAIFSGVVLTFVTTGSKTYRSTSSSAKVQMETQETFDQIEELIIDVNRSMYYANGSGSSIGSEIKNDIKQDGAANSTSDKTFIVCNEYKQGDGTSQYICDVLDWDKDDATIYYSQREYKATSSSENSIQTFSADDEEETVSDGEKNVRDAQTKVNRSVLATGILDFRADVSKVESDKIVRFQLSTQNGSKEIQTLHSVSLRNTVKIKKPSDSFDDAQTTDVGITIINAPESLDAGSDYSLIYDLTGNGSIDPTTVTWTVVQNPENGSFPSADPTNGKLSITDTASGTITVKVGAYTDKDVWVESAPVTIRINAKATPAPTTTPEPTATPEPTVTPEPTATPEPTVTPIPTPAPTDGEIWINDDAKYDTVIAGEKDSYECSSYDEEYFHLLVNGDYDKEHVKWTLKNNDSSVSLTQIDSKNANLSVRAGSKHGFTLCAEYIKNENGVKKVYKVERSFNVVNSISFQMTDRSGNIIENNGTVPAGNVYQVRLKINIYDVNGKLKQVDVTPENGNFWNNGTGVEDDNKAALVVSEDRQYWLFTPTTEGSKTIKVLEFGGITDGTIFNKYNYKLSTSMTVNVEGNANVYDAQIVGPDIVTQGEVPEYYLEIKDGEKEINTKVTWTTDGRFRVNNGTTETGENNKVKVSFYNQGLLGEYTITATYYATSNQDDSRVLGTVIKTFTLRKPEVELKIMGPDSGKKNGTGEYWLEATVDGVIKKELEVTWDNGWYSNCGKTTSNKDSKITMRYNQWQDSWMIKGTVNIAGTAYTATKVVTLS